MRAVNLLPSETRSNRSPRIDPLLGAGAAVTLLVVAGLAGGFVLEHSHASSERQQLAAVQAQLAGLKAQKQTAPKQSRVLAQPGALAQVQPWEQAVQAVLATRAPLDQTLAQLGRIVPANVTLTSLSVGGSGTSSTGGGAAPISLSGSAFSQQGVAEVLSRLTLVPGFSQVTLAGNSIDPKTGVVSFQVTAQMAEPGASAVSGSTAPSSTTTTTTTGAA